jgi:hypothetical protein
MLWHLRRRLLLLTDNEFIFVAAPVTGALLVCIIGPVLEKSGQGEKIRTFTSNVKHKLINSVKHKVINSKGFEKICKFKSSFKLKNKYVPKITSQFKTIKHVTERVFPPFLFVNIWKGVWIVIGAVAITRVTALSSRTIKASMRNRIKLIDFITTCLYWNFIGAGRKLSVNVAFALMTLLTSLIWIYWQEYCIYFGIILTINVCNTAQSTHVFSPRPLNIGLFGLPVIEHVIPNVNATNQQFIESSINISRKEDEVVRVLPPQNELPKTISKDIEQNELPKASSKDVEMNEIMKSSRLGEEESPVIQTKPKGLQRGKSHRTSSQVKLKPRTSSLQKLEQKPSIADFKSNFEEVMRNASESQKLSEGKVK